MNRDQSDHHSPLDSALEALNFGTVLDAVASHAATSYGKRRVLALQPGKPITDLQAEFERINALVGAVQRGEPLSFGGVRDLGDSLLIARTPGSFLDPGTLLNVADLARASRKLRTVLKKRREEFASLQWYAEALSEMPTLEKEVARAIDPNDARVADNASSELRSIRRELDAMDQKMRGRLDSLLKKNAASGLLVDSSYSLREGHYVISVRPTSKSRVKGIVHGRSQSGATLFVEPEELIELSGEKARLEDEEAAEVRRILIALTDIVREHLAPLEAAVDVVGILDDLQARAIFAEKLGAMRPVIGGDSLRLVQARHPLLALRKGLDNTVPLDLELGGDTGRCLVITGPNAGGKTVALKTVGLATAMVHAGLWPPAGDGTIVPELQLWHVVIGDDQSLESDLSSFSGHLEKLRAISEKPDAPKLVLVDEIASGTDPTEGSALASALLEEAIRRGWWTIVTTHMGQLKTFAHRTGGIRNGSMQFDRENLTPTYRFVPDVPGSSYALEIAARIGMDRSIVERAKEVLGEETLRLEDLIEELTDRLGKVHNRERELEMLKTQVSGMENVLRDRIGDLEHRRAEKLEVAAQQAERLLADANRTIENAVKEIRETQANRDAIKKAREIVEQQKKSAQETLDRSQKAKRENKLSSKADRKSAKPTESFEQPEELPGEVAVGDTVRMESGIVGEVLALQGKKAQVATGSIKVWMPLEGLTRIRDSRGRTGAVNVHLTVDEEAEPVRTELKLIGMRSEQAEVALEKYLEDLALSGLKMARIVHGKGTGALRAMVEEVLNRSSLVRGHRLGEKGEGGDGVTIVELTGD